MSDEPRKVRPALLNQLPDPPRKRRKVPRARRRALRAVLRVARRARPIERRATPVANPSAPPVPDRTVAQAAQRNARLPGDRAAQRVADLNVQQRRRIAPRRKAERARPGGICLDPSQRSRRGARRALAADVEVAYPLQRWGVWTLVRCAESVVSNGVRATLARCHIELRSARTATPVL